MKSSSGSSSTRRSASSHRRSSFSTTPRVVSSISRPFPIGSSWGTFRERWTVPQLRSVCRFRTRRPPVLAFYNQRPDSNKQTQSTFTAFPDGMGRKDFRVRTRNPLISCANGTPPAKPDFQFWVFVRAAISRFAGLNGADNSTPSPVPTYARLCSPLSPRFAVCGRTSKKDPFEVPC